MTTEFKLPELGEGIESADVVQVLVKEGDDVRAEQSVIELETDKAVVEVPLPIAGKVSKVHVKVGDSIKVGQPLFTIEESGEQPAKKKPSAKAAAPAKIPAVEKQVKAEETAEDKAEKSERDELQAAEKEPAAKPAAHVAAAHARGNNQHAAANDGPRSLASDGRSGTTIPAGPATRRLAHVLEIPLDRLKGTGPRGRITLEDVVRAHDARGGKAAAGITLPKLPDFRKEGEVEDAPLNKIAQTTIENLSRSWTLIPHVTQQGQADVTDVEKFRMEYVERAGKNRPKVTMTAIAVKAVVALLKEFPRFNSSVDPENKKLIHKKYYHVGIAVDTDRGLLVPVIRNADRKDIVDIAAEIGDLAQRAKDRKLEISEMQGATFTISNQGGIGGTAFTPIVNWPEVAILGMSRAAKQMVVVDDRPEVRLILPLSLSYDHRAVNGAEAARFIVRLGEILSDSHRLLFEA